MTPLLLALAALLAPDPTPAPRPLVIVVVGAPGAPEYAPMFRAWSDHWKSAAAAAGADFLSIGLDPDPDPKTSDRDALRSALASAPPESTSPLWLILIGHGTFDGRDARFNLRGPDLTERELATSLQPLKRPLVVINCASGSGPFLNALSGKDRVVITATRSGHEQNFARLGQYLSAAVADPSADLDKDGQVSLLEAYLTAGSRLAEYYKTHSQLATEHALLDDNGDALGTPADWFHGTRAVKKAKDNAPADGIRAHQLHLIPSARERSIPAPLRLRRDELERSLATLRDTKSTLGEDAYYAQLEPLLTTLARLYRDLEKPPHPSTPDPVR